MRYLILFCILLSPASNNLKVEKLCDLPGNINESSGMFIESPDKFWTHNDGGDLPYLYCIDSTGELLKKVFIQAKNNDWEELVLENGTVYIGDFGNNLNG